MIWKTERAIGLGMDEDNTEVVLHSSARKVEVDFMVDSVIKAVEDIKKAGDRVIIGHFDIDIGKCSVVKDLWNNEYMILDSTKGTYITDEDGNVIG
jgi:hypothetical protein